MNLENSPDFQAAIKFASEGNYSESRQFYQRLLDEAEAVDDVTAISFLMQSLGDIEARDGNLKLGHDLHRRALGQSPGVPLNLIAYAKSLVRSFNDAALCEHYLAEAEQMLQSGKWNQRIDKISIETYSELIEEVRKEIQE